MTADFSDYAALIRRFTGGEMVVEDFERTYLAKFKAETRAIEEPVYGILNGLFSDLDCYTTDEAAIAANPHFNIGIDTLRRNALAALAALEGSGVA